MSPFRRGKGWLRDEHDGLILLRIPQEIDLTTTKESPLCNPTTMPSLIALPTELQHNIISHLHPVDRVCLALTSRTLCSSVLSTPRLTPKTWTPFASHRYSWLPPSRWPLATAPESYTLIQRLAHGWTDKSTHRYCWVCNKILPRCESYFRSNMSFKRKPLKWSSKIVLPEQEWNRLSKKKRYDHLIKDWCYNPREDSSAWFCDHCRLRVQEECNSKNMTPGPFVECPMCVQCELFHLDRRPDRWKRIRAILKKHGKRLLGVGYALAYIFLFSWIIGLYELSKWIYRCSRKRGGKYLHKIKARWARADADMWRFLDPNT